MADRTDSIIGNVSAATKIVGEGLGIAPDTDIDEYLYNDIRKHKRSLLHMDNILDIIVHPLTLVITVLILFAAWYISGFVSDPLPTLIKIHRDLSKILGWFFPSIASFLFSCYIDSWRNHKD